MGTTAVREGDLRRRLRRRRYVVMGLAAVSLTGGTIVVTWSYPMIGPVDTAYRTLSATGHGRGMSQFGALEKAAAGASAQSILMSYYPGATLATIAPTAVRVRLTVYDNQTLDVYSDTGVLVAGRRVVAGQAAHLTPTPGGGAHVTVTMGCTGEQVWEGDTDDPRAYPMDPGPDRPPAEHLKVCDGSTFRGALAVTLEDGEPRTVNEVDVEDYLLGVVPAEMQANWADRGGAEALRAQAVAARSYALAEHRYPYAQTCDTTDCQQYPGTEKEDPRAVEAVRATAGQVLLREGYILRTEYSAAPGGGQPVDITTLEVGPAPAQLVPAAPAVPQVPVTPRFDPRPPRTDTAIDLKYAETGGPAGPLGAPIGPETSLPGQLGTFRVFQSGVIVWTPEFGARVVDPNTLARMAPGAAAPTSGHDPVDGPGLDPGLDPGSIPLPPSGSAGGSHGSQRNSPR
ncbi:SpoIID/LytB domain-containing protein [Nocardia sp. CDC159]|uniref:SpoIID/LytB domain-containing protein n=1 Tax=Nocardia pulmonis TaxID=2951408 RepID=A0A9X2E9N4_9NOCA|nr:MULTISPECIES: SpoIID/LytB domain-containing protein [Nocardia]MCM6776864.1 SpoIID/LytB domain-containing protein [Nocardia pulmonis]MCM6789288.1 SpoIID/LytB domain-containing protein [Nocardia sp. CDC159]